MENIVRFRLNVTEGLSRLRRSPCWEMDGTRRIDPGSSNAEGHHALNVEIEVRTLVPELEGG